jgi:hypothetical protein
MAGRPGVEVPPRPRFRRPARCTGCQSPIWPTQDRWRVREPDEFWHSDCARSAKLTGAPLSLFIIGSAGTLAENRRRRHGR